MSDSAVKTWQNTHTHHTLISNTMAGILHAGTCTRLSPLGEQQLWKTATWGEGGRREEEREGGWEVGKRGGRESKHPVGNSHSPGVAVESPFSFPYRYLFPAFPPSSYHSRILFTSLSPRLHSSCP